MKNNKNKKIIIYLMVILALLLGIGSYFIYTNKYSSKVSKEIENKKVEKQYYVLNKDGSIYFEDKNLENSIKKIMKLDKVYPDDALKVNHLILEDKKIKSLNGIEFFKEITFLDLEYNEIEDVSNLKYLSNLRILDLHSNIIKDIKDISNLEKLENLSISSNKVTDVSPLVNLKKLTSLPSTYNNNITNLDVLEKNLELYYNNNKNNYYEYDEFNVDKNIITFKTNFSNDEISECSEDYVTCITKKSFENDRLKIKTYKEAMKVARNFVKNNIDDNMADLEKEFAIIKYIANNVSYEKIDDRDDSVGTHDFYFPLVLHIGRCHDYSQAFNILGYLAGLEVESAYSQGAFHEWNLIKIDDVYYHVDITWADEGDTDIDYRYVNVSTQTMNKIHAEGWYEGKDITFTPQFYQTNISQKDMSYRTKMKYVE